MINNALKVVGAQPGYYKTIHYIYCVITDSILYHFIVNGWPHDNTDQQALVII